MLQSSGFGAELPARQVAANFTLNFEDILKLAKMADIDEFNKLLKPILIPRIVESQGHKQVEEFIKTTLTNMNFHTEVDEFVDKTPNGPKTFRNIIGTYSLEAERRLLLACHYDSKILEGEKFLGATDSAVPCALILALAKKLEPFLKKQQNPRITLQLVFFDGEEAFGNWTNTDSLYEIDRINAFMLLDLLGAKNPQIAHQIGHGTKPLFDKIVEIERQLNESGHLQKAEKVFHSV
ncbi:Glutaminyl-peptide cyclotransferase [Aphelenchoides bicaudatus]|nr:Glutaminyl-peptide cyclotransferase [Aphelenchoides bicaudatus]